jgi:hypothetical protein
MELLSLHANISNVPIWDYVRSKLNIFLQLKRQIVCWFIQ